MSNDQTVIRTSARARILRVAARLADSRWVSEHSVPCDRSQRERSADSRCVRKEPTARCVPKSAADGSDASIGEKAG